MAGCHILLNSFDDAEWIVEVFKVFMLNSFPFFQYFQGDFNHQDFPELTMIIRPLCAIMDIANHKDIKGREDFY